MTTLVADIGGTNTRVALVDKDVSEPREIARFRNAEFTSLDSVLRHYLDTRGNPACNAACVAVAGPVRDGVGRMTNLDWEMDGAQLCAATGAEQGYVINDLEAQGHALDDVQTDCILPAKQQIPSDDTRLVVGLGTGFNAAPVHGRRDSDTHVVPSECGHISLPVWDERSLSLADALIATHGFASVEEALSGRGLMAVHRHIAGPAAHDSTIDLIAALSAPDTTEAEKDTIALFCQILGRVLGDQALIHLPFGGIYLIGGLARAVRPFFEESGLIDAFRNKGRFSGFMKDFSLFIVEDDYSALTGCARYVRRQQV